MNWGKGITLAMVLFIGFIITLTVIKLGKVNASTLEDTNYYEREVNYEQEIQAQKKAIELGRFIVEQKEDVLVFSLDKPAEATAIKIVFSRPNNAKQDKKFEFSTSKEAVVSKKKLVSGKYKIEITYLINGKNCLQKEEVTI